VAALVSLRASAKREGGSVGRFGVGFAAVLALTDAPRVVGAAGGVAFSVARTAQAVAALPGPAAELARRAGQLPVLRLAWPLDPAEEPPPAGYDTEVRLPLREDLDPGRLVELARAQAEVLLLALPDLVEIEVAAAVLRRRDVPAPGADPAAGTVGLAVLTTEGRRSRWLLARRRGVLDPVDVASLAVEQRDRDWWVCWALPLADAVQPADDPAGDGLVPAPPAGGRCRPGVGAGVGDGIGDGIGDGEVLHAPTATVERMGLPARLIATVPLEPDRRHVRAGPAADRVLAGAAAAYVELVAALAPAHRLALLPAREFPRSAVDGRVRDLVLDALRAAVWLPGADGADVAPSRAQWLDVPGAPQLPALLAGCAAVPGLLAPVAGLAALDVLDVARLSAAGLADRLLGVEMAPSWWHAVYDALAPAVAAVPGLADELRALPVPLVATHPAACDALPEPADPAHRGPAVDTPVLRTVAGPASVLLPSRSPDPAVAALAELGLPGVRVAHPAAVHPLLARLGAAPAEAATLLEHPAVRAAVRRSVEDADAGLDVVGLAAAVLGLVSGPRPELAALALPAEDGWFARADELLLPDAVLRPLLADDAPFGVLDPAWAARFPRHVLTAAGVLDGFAVLVDEQPEGPDHDLDDERRWWDGLDAPPARLVAVRDLDLVADEAWPGALALLAAGRETRAALLAPAPGGLPSYTAWWLSRHACLGGHRPGHWRLPAATRLAGLYDRLPDAVCDPAVDTAVLAAAGVRAALSVTDAGEAGDLLARLADPARTPDAALVAQAHTALAQAVREGRVDPADVRVPQRVRARDGAVVDVELAVVLDRPWLAPALPASETVLGGDGALAAELAELLDLPLAHEVVTAAVVGQGRAVRWVDLPEVVLACGGLGRGVPDGELHLHDTLLVSLTRPVETTVEVPAWCDDAGRWHGADPVRALLARLAC